MKPSHFTKTFFALLLLLGFSTYSFSQHTISGTITDKKGIEIIGAHVIDSAIGEGDATDAYGNFSFQTFSEFPVKLVISHLGYDTLILEVTNNDIPLNVFLEGLGITLPTSTVTSVSKSEEKEQDAPASTTVFGLRQLSVAAQNVNPVGMLRNVPGVQIQQQSASRINIEMRAAADLFGTSVFPIMDYRSLVVPGTRMFQSDAAGISFIDLEQIEIVRGPASALYGPGVTSGVVHFITKNPIDYPGTTVQVGYGELNTFLSALRHAGRNDKGTWGYKINAQYNRGDEFSLDPNDSQDSAQIALFKTTIVEPAITNNRVDLTQPGRQLLSLDDLDKDSDSNPMANEWWNVAFNGTAEYRPNYSTSITLSGGYNEASAVFYNDLGEGLSQSSEVWAQARFQSKGLFAQFFVLDNNGGTNEKPTFLYQTGNISPIGRKQLEGQLQYNFETPSLLNAEWTIGADYRLALSNTRHMTYGRNEDNDDFRIMGGYAQGKFAFADELDLVLAGRYDEFNFLDEGFFSPRVALVYKPKENHTFRATYNRAGAPPAALQAFVDFPVNVPAPGILDLWLAGQNEVQSFGSTPMIDLTLPGAPDIPWGTPGLPLAIPFGAVNDSVIDAICTDPNSELQMAIKDWLLAYSPSGFTGSLIGIDASTGGIFEDLIDTKKPTININNTFEVGYKGVLSKKLSLSADLYWVTQKGFSDFAQIGPLMTLQGADIPTDLGNAVTEDITPFLIELLEPQVGMEQAIVIANSLATTIGGAYTQGGQALVDQAGPLLGNAFGTVETDQMPQGDGIAHVPMGYRIFPDANLSYWGTDIGMEYFIKDELSVWANYSYVSQTEFSGEELNLDENSPLSINLNVPPQKFRFGLNYLPESGFRGSLSFQHDDSFNASVGQYSGKVEAKNLIDASIGYDFGNGLAIDIAGTNVFNNEYRAFPNMPNIGRRVVAKATYHFGGE